MLLGTMPNLMLLFIKEVSRMVNSLWASRKILSGMLSHPVVFLTHCCLVTPYGDRVLVNIGSGNGLLPDGTKPLPEPMLTNHHWNLVTFISGRFHKRCLNHQSLKFVWKLHNWNFNQISQGRQLERPQWALFLFIQIQNCAQPMPLSPPASASSPASLRT